jgi:hypothetical protein
MRLASSPLAGGVIPDGTTVAPHWVYEASIAGIPPASTVPAFFQFA